MNISERVESWIEWSKDALRATGDIPKINSSEFTAPWLEDVRETAQLLAYHRDELLVCFLRRLDSDPTDLPSRFTALHLYRAFRIVETVAEYLAGYSWPEGAEGAPEEMRQHAKIHESEAGEVTRACALDLDSLVHQLDIEKVPADWRFIRWEILNSYAVHDWDRGSKLYEEAEKLQLLDLPDLQLMRGQFKYLLVYGSEIELKLDSLWWEPKLYDPGDPEHALLLFASGLRLNKPATHFRDSNQDTLRDAANDLEKALSKSQTKTPVYNALLARCYSSLGRFREAAAQYSQVLTSQLVTSAPFLRKPVYKTLTSVYQAGCELQEAISTLEQWAQDFPEEKGIYLQVAELQTQMGDFDSVPTAIRMEVERNPEADRDWRIANLLALGETRDISRKLLEELRSTPEVYETLKSFLADYWEPFSRLSKDGRDRWISGTWLTHFNLQRGTMRDLQLRQAADEFAKAVEVELSEKVFLEFRERARKKPELLLVAQQGAKGPKPDVLCQFVVGGGRAPTMGEMLYFLNPDRNSQEPAFAPLRLFLQRSCPRVTGQLPSLDRINKFRVPEAHGRFPVTNVEEISTLCRAFLETLLQPSDSRGVEPGPPTSRIT